MLFGVLALMSYQLVDAAWIALLGVDPLAALGFTLPVQQIIIGLQIGLGIATTAIISRTLGAGDLQRAKQQGGLILLIGMGLLALLSLMVWLARHIILDFLGVDASLKPLIESFWLPWLLSAWLGAVVYLGYSQHRANGDTRFTGLMMVLVSSLNLIFDPLFIFTFGWGLNGAAWATVAAFTVGGVFTFPRLWKRQLISLNFINLNRLQEMRGLFAMAGPAALSQLMPAAASLLATGLVASFGIAAVAAWGLGARLEMFSIVIVLALTMSLPPLLGRFAGAKDWQAVEELIRLAVRFIIIWQLAIAIIWLVLSKPLTQFLTKDVEVSALVMDYLLKLPFSYSGLGVCILMVSASNALGMPVRALIISILRLFACYLPFLWAGAYLGGINSLFTGALIGNLLAGLLAWQMYQQGLKHLRLQTTKTG
ncbi:MAG: MATE family efflux transporter [Pseudomonadaceae bacterium]|nr:MATE family efflux transporter [Pseudomonadaceae bacterium]